MLERLGTRRIGVELEDDGIDVAQLEQALADGHVPKLVHIIPNFHNPAGCTLSEAKRRRLVELSAEHGFWIFEDDPYREVRFAGAEELPTMLALAEGTEAKVIHASSFSKTVSPGVRVGYLAGPAEEIATLAKRANETYISPEHAGRVDRLRALPLRRPRRQHRARQRRPRRTPRRGRRRARRKDP